MSHNAMLAFLLTSCVQSGYLEVYNLTDQSEITVHHTTANLSKEVMVLYKLPNFNPYSKNERKSGIAELNKVRRVVTDKVPEVSFVLFIVQSRWMYRLSCKMSVHYFLEASCCGCYAQRYFP